MSYLRTFLNRETAGQLAKLAIIGVVNTAVYFTLLNVFRTMGIELLLRTTLAFALATLVSYVLNRRWTFKIEHGAGLWRESWAFLGVNALAWAATAAIVLGADALWGPLSRLEENLANVVAGGVILLPKLAGYRDLVFKGSLAAMAAERSEPDRDGVPGHLPEGAQSDTAP